MSNNSSAHIVHCTAYIKQQLLVNLNRSMIRREDTVPAV